MNRMGDPLTADHSRTGDHSYYGHLISGRFKVYIYIGIDPGYLGDRVFG